MFGVPIFSVLVFFCVSCQAAPQTLKWTDIKAASKNDDHQFQFHSNKVLELDEAWSSFKKEHGKTYRSEEDESVRKLIFAETLKKIEIHNYLHSKGLKSYTMGINQFSDMTLEEFLKRMNGYRRSNKTSGSTYLSPNIKLDLPDQVDWRNNGYVTPVKDQGQCGSCWSFSTTGSVEGQHFRKTGTLISLSEQNLVDCSGDEGNHGCNGGLMDAAFKYIQDNGGIDTEASYPYTAQQGECQYDPNNIGATVSGFVDVQPPGDECQLQQAVATIGPVSVAIDANHDSFKNYQSGVYDEPGCTDQLDHGVLVVGYGTMNGQDYWLVKNSWNTVWGDQGYIYMSRNKNNQCGIASQASYPLV